MIQFDEHIFQRGWNNMKQPASWWLIGDFEQVEVGRFLFSRFFLHVFFKSQSTINLTAGVLITSIQRPAKQLKRLFFSQLFTFFSKYSYVFFSNYLSNRSTLQETNISHLGKRKIIDSNMPNIRGEGNRQEESLICCPTLFFSGQRFQGARLG